MNNPKASCLQGHELLMSGSNSRNLLEVQVTSTWTSAHCGSCCIPLYMHRWKNIPVDLSQRFFMHPLCMVDSRISLEHASVFLIYSMCVCA